MIFQQILLKIFLILNKERTVSSAYHLLRGKRSGQTIQDVGMFKLHEYFGLFPKLKRKAFDDTIQELVNQNQLIVHEDIMVTAVREVEEETGVSGIVPEKLLCVTDHCYYRDGICHLKHTWWYLMSCTSGSNLVPQTEEGITETEFVGKDRLEDIMKCTYPSIADVFDAALRNDETFI